MLYLFKWQLPTRYKHIKVIVFTGHRKGGGGHQGGFKKTQKNLLTLKTSYII